MRRDFDITNPLFNAEKIQINLFMLFNNIII